MERCTVQLVRLDQYGAPKRVGSTAFSNPKIPSLCVNRNKVKYQYLDGDWAVTHVESGRAIVVGLQTRRAAEIAMHLADESIRAAGGSWDQPEKVLLDWMHNHNWPPPCWRRGIRDEAHLRYNDERLAKVKPIKGESIYIHPECAIQVEA